MKDLDKYRIREPTDRYKRIAKLVATIQDCSVFKEWGIIFQKEFAKIKAKQLPYPKIIDQGNKTRSFEDYEKRKVKHVQPVQLKKNEWAMAYDDFDSAKYLWEGMIDAAGAFGIKVEEPKWIEIPYKSKESYFRQQIKA